MSEIDAQYSLLDRQIVDRDRRLVGKVDDVELEEREDGRLVVTALLTGPGALGPRFGGPVGAVVRRTWSRLSGKDVDSAHRIEFEVVSDLDTVVHLGVAKASLDADGFEQWVRTRIIEKIPGAGQDPS
jgi:sporulation protein YlmC with PRC-barrel domain